MDTTQIEQELEELEARMERLRALYEQYFLGLEKLEPTVLRKDVDRKLWVLRREKIRNTGMRFKFQGLVQRYNTYQQYWTRVVREIEAGTYRRDILKVAQRFGEKDAVTLLGKKRAEQYRRLAQNQLDRRNKRRGATGEAAQPAPPAELDDAPLSLGADDIELVDDDASDTPTPPRVIPPVRAVPPPRPAGATARDAEPEPDMEALLLAATVGVSTWTQRPKTAPPPPPKPASTAAPSKRASAAPPAPPRRPSAAPPKRASAVPPAPPKAASTAPPKRASTVPPKPSRPESPAPTAAKQAPPATSGKSRVAELAAQMRAKKEAAKPVTAALDLDNLFDAKPAAAPPPSPQPAPPKPATAPTAAPQTATPQTTTAPTATASPLPKPAPTFAPSAPQPKPATPFPATTFTPSAAQPKPAAATPPAPKPAVAATPPAPKPAVAATPPAPKPAVAATPPAPKPAASSPSREALDDQRVREIYARYVGAKRAANESTAGVTFDKLAQSLRAQADKLKSTHPTKSVDFEVVVKDGKTALRPILK